MIVELSNNIDILLELYALINNAGVMTIADYEVQPPQIFEHTVNVNLLGPMRMVSAFLPELRKYAAEVRTRQCFEDFL